MRMSQMLQLNDVTENQTVELQHHFEGVLLNI